MVSIIIPTYNRTDLLPRAIQSVINQTYKDWELLIVDDCSKDKTPEIIKDWERKDQRIKGILLDKNSGGPAIPRTVACKAAKGECIAFLDQDDLYYPEYLESKVSYLEKHPEVDVLSSLAWAFDEKTKKIINVEHGGPVNFVMRKKVIEIGEYFKPEQNGVDELGLLMRYTLKDSDNVRKQMLINSEPMTLYSRHPDQGSYVENKDPLMFVRRINGLISEFNLDTKNIKEPLKTYIINNKITLYSRLGNYYCLAGRMEDGRRSFEKSLSYKFNYFSAYLLILSYLGHGFYRKIELFSRLIQRKFFWRLKAEIYKLKYKQSYGKAIEILSQIK